MEENPDRNPEGSPIIWDEVVLDAVRAEADITLFLNTDVRELETGEVDGERIVTSVRGWTMGSEYLDDLQQSLFPTAPVTDSSVTGRCSIPHRT